MTCYVSSGTLNSTNSTQLCSSYLYCLPMFWPSGFSDVYIYLGIMYIYIWCVVCIDSSHSGYDWCIDVTLAVVMVGMINWWCHIINILTFVVVISASVCFDILQVACFVYDWWVMLSSRASCVSPQHLTYVIDMRQYMTYVLPLWPGTCESEIFVWIEYLIESGCSCLRVECRLPQEVCRSTAYINIK